MKAYWSPSLVLLFFNIGVFCSVGQGIRIESAYYGPPNKTGVDVTRSVQQFADYGEPFRVGSDTLRIDPSPNHPKFSWWSTRSTARGSPTACERATYSISETRRNPKATAVIAVRAFKSSGRSTAREADTWMSQRLVQPIGARSPSLLRCRTKHSVSILIRAGRNG